MDKKIAGLLGAAAALTAAGGAQAAVPAQTELAPAASYRDLLQPVPNAVAALKTDDERAAEKAVGETRLAWHHHHHHHHWRRHHHHHHHHHHHLLIIR
jgi:hypothetical protein